MFRLVVVAAPAGSNVSRRKETKRMQPEREPSGCSEVVRTPQTVDSASCPSACGADTR